MSPEIAAALAAAVAAVIGAAIQGFLNKRKLSAEATQVITEAAKGVVERMEVELDRVNGKRKVLERRIEELEGQLRAHELVRLRVEEDWRQALQLHAAWDSLAIQNLSSNADLPPAPPLYPPQKLTGRRVPPVADMRGERQLDSDETA